MTPRKDPGECVNTPGAWSDWLESNVNHRTWRPRICEYCQMDGLEGAPLGICGSHLRELYVYAQDTVNDGWREAVDAYLSTLVPEPSPRGRREPLGPGVVYFVRIGDVVKIGFTTNSQRRMSNLMPDEVLHMQPGTMQDEKRLHVAFRHLRVRGERFRPDPELMDFIRGLKTDAA